MSEKNVQPPPNFSVETPKKTHHILQDMDSMTVQFSALCLSGCSYGKLYLLVVHTIQHRKMHALTEQEKRKQR